MPHYHMNVRCQSGLTKDLEGGDYPDFEHACQDALFSAKQMMAEVLRGGGSLSVTLGNSIEITDAEGQIVATVPFAEGAAANLKGLSQQWADEG